jgi:hypothetical protein
LGVELLVCLVARNADPPCTTELSLTRRRRCSPSSLARSIRRSVSYTEQLIAQLREAGLVKPKHGPGGGYYLTRPTDRITVADAFRVFDGPRTLDGRVFAPQALTQSEIAEVSVPISFGRRLTATSCCSWRRSLADIAPDTDGALPNHVGHEERGAGISDTKLVTVH